MKEDIQKILISKEQLAERVKELGVQISRDYEGKVPLLISVLKGSILFMADLMREITIKCDIDFMAVSSYGAGRQTSGVVRILKDLDTSVEGRHIIIVEDILDSGVTLSHLLDLLKTRNVASIRICTLLDKPERRRVQVDVDYRGFIVPDEFVVGYGLDYADMYRNLPYVGVLKPSVYGK
ncbi:MAG TPA: hypoxanthine phosphoribosyltransferase [Clostridiales bacterium]|nr:hypoxanthine phosphoribosyltransferase [Clostridiales bacterium]